MFDLERDIFGGHFNFIFSRLTEDITNEGWQKFATPKTVCDMMIEKYEYKQTDKILVLFNAELIMSLYTKFSDEFIFSNVYFIADTMKKKNYIEKYLGKINCKYLEEKNWTIEKLTETIKEFNMKHFDVVFTNPPYNDSKDITLLNTLIENDMADKIVAVHPTSFLFCKDLMNKKDKMKSWLKSVNIFWGNVMFHISLFVPICISIWDKTNKSKTVHVVDNGYSNEEYDIEYDKLSYYGKRNNDILELEKQIKNYMEKHNGSILDHNIKEGYKNMTKYSVRFAAVRGTVILFHDGMCEDYWTLICKDDRNKCDETFRYSKSLDKMYGKQMCIWSFSNEKERENYINYCKTKIVRFILTFTKKNVNLVSGKVTRIIPWLDFSKKWTDEKLIKEFDINKELWDYIDKFIPDYYDDYKTTVRGNI